MRATASASIKLTTTTLRGSLLSLFGKFRTSSSKLEHFKKIHCVLTICGLSHDTFLLTKLLLHSLTTISHVTAGNLSYISSLFDLAEKRNAYLWNAMIRGFSTSSEPHMSIVFYLRMRQNGVVPNKHTFPLLLKAFSRSKNENPFQVYSQTVKFGLNFDHFVQNSLVSAFARSGYVDYARKVFDEIILKDTIAWTAMIDGYLRNDFAAEALECFLEMRSMNVWVDEMTVVSVLGAAGMVGHVWFGKWVHGFYVESGRVHWDVYVGSALVDMYSKCGYCDDAFRVFNEMPFRNFVSWSVMIAGYVQCNKFKDAVMVFQDMLLEGVEPNQYTLTSVLTACAQLGALNLGKWVHGYIDMNKFEVNLTLGTALIDLYSKCGSIQEAFSVFEKMLVKDVYPWTAMINGLAMNGEVLASLRLFYEMLNNGVQPNEVTLIGVLSACSHGGLVDEGRELFGSMSSVYNIEPNADHYGCIVDLLGRAGHLEEAVKLIKDMPMEPTPGVWGALFGACVIHKDYELGKQIGEHLIKIQPHHSGLYVLLANLYSTCHSWEAAAHIRKLMKGKGVEKTPGCSWMELNGVIHEFIAFDSSHTESMGLYALLGSIVSQSKLASCVPDTNISMFDIKN